MAEFLDARSVFFDESHDVLQVMDVTRPDEYNIQARTRLWFFLRREPSEDRWRVVAQIVEGFAQLNENAATLFGAPTEGLRT